MTNLSYALSLGELKVNSHFAQPFNAEIALPSYSEEELESLDVRLASRDQFKSRGMEMYSVIRKLKFGIKKRDNGELFIEVTTIDPMKELSISFLIEVTWTGGRLIKGYDFLLTPEAITDLWEERELQALAELKPDPKPEKANNFSDGTLTPPAVNTQSDIVALNIKPDNKPLIQQAAVEVPIPEKKISKKAKAKSNSKFRKKTKNISNGLQYKPVGRGESLSLIAQKIRPNKDISINQMMVALYDQNRHAFINENINKLAAGSTLTINDIQSVTKISKRKAMQMASNYMNGPLRKQANTTQLAKNNETAKGEKVAAANVTQPPPKPIVTSQLKITSETEDPIPQEILQKLKKEQIASDEEELKMAMAKAEELIVENKTLRKKIATLEDQLDATAESLFEATIQSELNPDVEKKEIEAAPEKNSQTQQAENLVVTNTNVTMEGNENLSFLERLEAHRTIISVTTAILLLITFVVMKKQNEVATILNQIKSRFVKTTHPDDVPGSIA